MKPIEAVILCTLVALPALPVLAQDEEVPAESIGRDLYEANCAVCHMFDGSGVPMMQPELILSPRANGEVGGVIDMILKGSAAVPKGMSDYSNEMPSFDFLTDEDIALIATYVRTNFENSGGAVTVDDVRSRRQP